VPEATYEDWAIAANERIGSAVASARHRLASQAEADARWDDVVEQARAVLELDAFDERAHELLVGALRAAGRRGEAQQAADRYSERMAELGVPARDLLDPGD
jgi:DNA-binding SARP family transcriptional activator